MADENDIEAEIRAAFDRIAGNCDRLDLMVNKEPPSRRTTAKIRVDQLKYDCQHLQAALRNVQHRRSTLYSSSSYCCSSCSGSGSSGGRGSDNSSE